MDEALTIETPSLADLEAVIERGMETFVEVGSALLAIRDGRLYRETHGTFEDYCRGRWGFDRRRASELIGAAQAVTQLSVISDIAPPRRESHAAELARIPNPETRAEVWQRAVEERGEIELAENLNRKDLTAIERSRQMVRLAETAAEVLRSEEVLIHDESKPNGRPPEPDSERKVAERLGVSQPTINRAKQHVAAIDAYPELTPLPQSDALGPVLPPCAHAAEDGGHQIAQSNCVAAQGKLALHASRSPQ